MIGTINLQNSDLFVFVEKGEMEGLRDNNLEGIFIDLNQPLAKAVLEMKIGETKDLLDTEFEKDEETGLYTSVKLIMNISRYKQLVERGTTGEHQGWRHVSISDATRLDSLPYSGEKYLYKQLVMYRQ